MQTNDFQTKTMFMNRKQETVDKYYPVSLDIGYSAVKGFSPNKVYCFPSYARKKTAPVISIGVPDDSEILYRDSITGEEWVVGSMAYSMIASDETKESAQALYGRNRYFSPMFKVIARCGMGIGILENNYGSAEGKTIVLQTGLPPAYLKSDSGYMLEVLEGLHSFDIKIGSGDWTHIEFTLDKKNIFIMPQPMGTLFSIATDNNGKQTKEAVRYFNSNVIIFDAGFGTLDIFDIRNRSLHAFDTFDDLGMKRVLQETGDAIYERYHTEVPVYAMQPVLKNGFVKVFDRKNMRTTKQPIEDILEETNKAVCFEAIEKVKEIYNSLLDHDYLVITGGTGAAWEKYIESYFKDMETLTLIKGGLNDVLPCTFANARGYYMYLIGNLQRNHR